MLLRYFGLPGILFMNTCVVIVAMVMMLIDLGPCENVCDILPLPW
jgi:hypothetical protein